MGLTRRLSSVTGRVQRGHGPSAETKLRECCRLTTSKRQLSLANIGKKPASGACLGCISALRAYIVG